MVQGLLRVDWVILVLLIQHRCFPIGHLVSRLPPSAGLVSVRTKTETFTNLASSQVAFLKTSAWRSRHRNAEYKCDELFVVITVKIRKPFAVTVQPTC